MFKTLVCCVAIFTAIASATAAKRSTAGKLAHLPDVVRKTVEAQADGGKVTSISRDTDDDGTSFDIEVTKDGESRSFTVEEDGRLSEMEVFLAETPEAVQKTIKAQAGKNEIAGISKVFDGDDFEYDVEVTQEGASRYFSVAADGTLLSAEITLAEASDAVQKAIQSQLGTGEKIASVTKTFDDSEVSYEIEATSGDKTRAFTVDARGKLVDTEIALSDAPPPVQKAIQQQLGTDGVLEGITKLFDDEAVTFDVEISKKGDSRSLTFDSEGNIVIEEIDVNSAPEPVRKTIKAQPGKFLSIYKLTDDSGVAYDVEFSKDGKSAYVSISPDGKIVAD